MKLPSTSVITDEKIRDYLLSPRKRNDKSKWLAEAGYILENWQRLEKDLRTQILPMEALSTDKTEYGQMFEIRGKLTGPNGKALMVRTIWMEEYKSGSTKFITMFPDKK